MERTLRILLFKPGSQWVAQCLDVDLVAQGPEIDDALEAFASVLTGRILLDLKAGREPLSSCEQPPAKYLELARRAKALRDNRQVPDQSSEWGTIPPTILEPLVA
jgi:hypothetical protein